MFEQRLQRAKQNAVVFGQKPRALGGSRHVDWLEQVPCRFLDGPHRRRARGHTGRRVDQGLDVLGIGQLGDHAVDHPSNHRRVHGGVRVAGRNLDRFDIAWHHTHRADRVVFLDVEKLFRVRVLEDLHRGNLLSLRRVGRGLGGRLVVGLLLVLGLRLIGAALVLGGISLTFGFGRGLPTAASVLLRRGRRRRLGRAWRLSRNPPRCRQRESQNQCQANRKTRGPAPVRLPRREHLDHVGKPRVKMPEPRIDQGRHGVRRHLAIPPDPRPSSAREGDSHCRPGSLGFRPVRRMDQVPAIE